MRSAVGCEERHMKRRTCGLSLLILALLCLAANAACMAETVWGDLDARLNAGRIEVDGVSYRPRKQLTTVLLMGIDRWEAEADAGTRYRNGGQADFQLLVVLDEREKTVSALHVNRDLMAEMTVVNLLGEAIGTRTAQICLAYSYGDGDQLSCELTKDSLSARLMNIPIDSCLAMRLDGISALNDALGGVEVTLDEDFSVYDPAMTPGTTLTLTGRQAEYYLRYRYDVGDGSNASRLLRQRSYMEAAKPILRQKLEGSASELSALLDAVEPYLVTDMSRGRLMNLFDQAARCTIEPVLEMPGENVVGESGYYEFYPDEEALTQILLDLFYEPI